MAFAVIQFEQNERRKKMKKKIILTPLICLSFLTYCSRETQPEVEEIVLEEKSEPANVKFVFEKKVEVPDMAYPSLHTTGKELYVLGFSTEKHKKVILNIYNEALELCSQKEFNIGKGPGDLGTGCFIFKFDDRIYFPDNTQMRVNIFDNEFNFIKFVPLTKQIFLPVTFIKNGNYFLGTTPGVTKKVKNIYHSYIVQFPGLSKKPFHTLGPMNTWSSSSLTAPRKYVYGSIPDFHYFYKNEKIYFIKMDDYQLSLFDMEGQLLKKARVNVEKKKVPKEKKIPWLNEIRGRLPLEKVDLTDHIQPAGWMIPLDKGFAVVRKKGYGTRCKGMVEADYFDYQLNPMGKLEVPCFYRIYRLRRGYFVWVCQYQDGYLYLINEDEGNETFYLEKWKVTE